jgi:hypothetical protein
MTNQKKSSSRGLVRRQNTLARIERVQARFKELSAMRFEGNIKPSTNSIVDSLATEFCLSTYTVYDFLATDTVGRKQEIEDLTGQKSLFD